MRQPDEVIGSHDDPYMLRWILFRPAKNKRVVRIVPDGPGRGRLDFQEVPKKRTFLPSIYLHEFKRSDDDRHFHDHVGWSISFIVPGWLMRLFGVKDAGGSYWELLPSLPLELQQEDPRRVAWCRRNWRLRIPGTITFRRAHQPHIIALDRFWRENKYGQHMPLVLRYPTHGKRIFSLWIRGPWRREWGFYTEDGWVAWDQYHKVGASVYESKGP